MTTDECWVLMRNCWKRILLISQQRVALNFTWHACSVFHIVVCLDGAAIHVLTMEKHEKHVTFCTRWQCFLRHNERPVNFRSKLLTTVETVSLLFRLFEPSQHHDLLVVDTFVCNSNGTNCQRFLSPNDSKAFFHLAALQKRIQTQENIFKICGFNRRTVDPQHPHQVVHSLWTHF